MEAKLTTETINFFDKKLDTVFTHEETAEIIVPDAMLDILEIIDTKGMVTVKDKEAENGRVVFTGMVNAEVLYRPEEEDKICRLELGIPFTAMVEAAEVTPDSQLYSMVHLGCLDSRMINSRKALVRADVVVEVAAYELSELTWSMDLNDDSDAGIEVLRDKGEVTLVTQIKEKSFVIAEEFTLPAGKAPIEEIYRTGVEINNEDVKSVGNKLIFKGEIIIDILYRGSGETEPQRLEYTAPFSQIIEMDNDIEDAVFAVKLILTNCYIDGESAISEENRAVAAEVHLSAQALCKEKFYIPFISDVYCAKYELSESREDISAVSEMMPHMISGEVREIVELAEPVFKILDCHFTIGKATCTEEDGAMCAKTSVCASAMYMTDEGKIRGINRRFEVKGTGECNNETASGISARIMEDARASAMGNSIEFLIPVQFEICPSTRFKSSSVCGASWDEEGERDLSALPSIVVHHALENETIWNMAKKYCSSKELIIEVNGIEEDMEPEAGRILIIPRKG